MQPALFAAILCLMLSCETADAQRQPNRPVTAADSAAEIPSLVEADEWFATRLGSLLGATLMINRGANAESLGSTAFTTEEYDHVNLGDCVLQFTNTTTRQVLALPGERPDRSRASVVVKIPLRDLDVSSISTAEVRDRAPRVALTPIPEGSLRIGWRVGLSTTKTAGRTIRIGRYLNSGFSLFVNDKRDGELVVTAPARTAQLCGAAEPRS